MYLMLKDTEVLYFDLEDFVVEIIRKDLMPMCLRGKQFRREQIQNNINLIKEYLSNRALNSKRDNRDKICKLFDLHSRLEISLANKSLSVNDSYWVKGDNERISFDEVNLRKRKFTEIVDIALYGNEHGLYLEGLNPELTTQGLFRKAWIQRDKRLFLLKSDKHINNINTRMEVLASDILKCFSNKINTVEYTGKMRNGIYVSKCENFVTEEYSFIEAWEIIEYCKDTNMNFVDCLGYSSEAASIAVLDFIINNTDRHTQNYGFMMNNNTGDIVCIAPLFDFNCALIADVYNRNGSDTLSQMFNTNMTLRQVADFYRQYHDLRLDMNKFNKLRDNRKEYDKVFDNVLERCKYIGIKFV